MPSLGLAAQEQASHTGWRVALLASVIYQITSSSPGQGIPTLGYFLQTDLALSKAQLGMFSTSLSVGIIASGVFSGWLADRVGTRQVLLAGQVLTGAFVMLMGFGDSFPVVVLALLPAGIGSGMVNPAVTKAMMYWFPPRMRATAMGVKQTGTAIAGAIAAATLPAMALTLSWRAAVIALGVAIIVLGVASHFLHRQYLEAPRPAGERGELSLRQALRMLANRDMLIATALSVPLVTVQYCVVTFLPLYLKEELLFPVLEAAMFLSLAQLGSIAGRVMWGGVSDYLFGTNRRWTMMVISIMVAAVAAGLGVLPAAAPGWLVAVLAIGAGVTAMGWHGVYKAQIGELAGKRWAGTAAGFNSSVMQLGVMVGVPLFGYAVDLHGSYRLAWLLSAGLALFSAALLLLVRERSEARASI